MTPIKTYMKADKTGSNKRAFGEFICTACEASFEARMDRIKKMTGLCRPCINIVTGNRNRIHGHTNQNSRIHVTWSNMKRRCINPTEKEKRNYFGISVCEDWMEFIPFMEWALNNGYTDEMTIDRVDSDKGYCPSNCRFVGYGVQSANRKITNKNKSGFIGVSLQKGKFCAGVQWKKNKIHLGRFTEAIDAAKARDKYIVDNNLPHALNEYQRD